LSFKPNPKQALVMWHLLITGNEPKLSDVKPELKPAERKPLEEAGLIALEKRGRSKHMVLTDRAWEWALDHFDAEVSKSSSAAPVLQTLLVKLKAYLQLHAIPLAELLGPQDEQVVGSGITPIPPHNLEEKVRAAYTSVAGGTYNVRVRLSELRRYLDELSREEVDSTLLAMQLEGKLVLMHLDDPQEITLEDEQAAVDVSGHKRHLVYMKG
jgi:hypothetical protein